jgi:hypothetical protein
MYSQCYVVQASSASQGIKVLLTLMGSIEQNDNNDMSIACLLAACSQSSANARLSNASLIESRARVSRGQGGRGGGGLDSEYAIWIG